MRRWKLRLRSLFRKRQVEQDLKDELSFHLAMQTRSNHSAGLPAAMAVRAAKVQFGGFTQHREACRDQIYGSTELFLRSVRFSLRNLLHGRAYLTAILVLAAGIGVSTSVFSLAQAVIFHPLPFPDQQSLRVIWKADPKAGVPFLELAYPELNDLQTAVPAFASVALMPTTLYGYGKVLRVASQQPVQIESAPVSRDFFKTLGVHPILGRDFNEADEHTGSAPVVILSYRTWVTLFHADPKVLNQQISLNGAGYTVIGVTQQDVDFPRGVGLWVPLGAGGDLQTRNDYYLQAIARVKPGYSERQLFAQIDGLFKRLARQYPQFYLPNQGAVVTDLPAYWTGSSRWQLLLSLAASMLLLLASCITASNLFLSRTLARRQEIATRSSLGASRSQIAGQFLTEGAVAGLIAAMAGLLIGAVITKLLIGLAPPDIPRLEEARSNWQVLGFGIMLALVAGVACSTAPALAAVRLNLEAAMREGSNRLASNRTANRLQMFFTVAQTASSVILLSASILVVVSVQAMLRTDTGFHHQDALTMNLAVHGAATHQRRAFYQRLLERLGRSPAVTNAGGVLVRPFEGTIGWDMSYQWEFDADQQRVQSQVSNFEVITPGYFQAIGTALLEGRNFTDHDSENTRKVVIISDGLARTMRSTGHEPIGSRIRFGRRNNGEWWTIVGIAGNTRYRGITTRDEDIYVSYLQSEIPVNYLVIRGPGTSPQLTRLVRAAVAELDPSQPVANVATVGELMQRDTARQRFNMLLLLSFGVTSLLLTGAGVYSVVAEAVSLKRREIAIRLALGSDRRTLVLQFAAATISFVLAGESIGLVVSLWVGQLLSGLLYGVQPHESQVYGFVFTVIAAFSLLAASLPAWAASGLSPRAVLQ